MSKGLVDLGGRPLLLRAVSPLLEDLACLVVTAREEEIEAVRGLLAEGLPWPVPVAVVPGGRERADSVRAALEWLAEWRGWRPEARHLVAIHDAARPFLPRDLWRRLIEAALREGAAVPGLPIPETVKRVDPEGRITATVDRRGLWRVQTPQVFAFEEILAAHRRAFEMGLEVTDDAQVYELTGRTIMVVPGVWENIKITTGEDLSLARLILAWRGEDA